MFASTTQSHSIFHFFPNQSTQTSFKEAEEQSNFLEYSPSPKLRHRSAKKLSFADEDPEVFVSEFSCPIENPEEPFLMNTKNMMELEEENVTLQPILEVKRECSIQTPPKLNKIGLPSLQVTVPPKYSKKEQEIIEVGAKNNQNIIGMWRNDSHHVFKGKFSSGATPKLKSFDSDVFHIPKINKKVKKSLFSNQFKEPQSKKFLDFSKENLGDCNNYCQEQIDFSRDRTPSPKKKNTNHFNTMSIKKERKIFDRREDIDMTCEDDFYKADMRFMSTVKQKNYPEVTTCPSRFVNDYEILEVIGSGCFGTVYKCLNKFDNMIYAIKCTKNRIKGSKTRHLSLHEAQALAAFSSCDENSYIVRYYNAWIEDERLYLVMEHCAHSLKHLKSTQKYFSESQIRHILRDIAEGLKSLHKRNVVHLDIKPENILFSKTQKYKISDLGLSRIAKRSKGEEISEGDSRYLAPELLLDLSDGFLPDLSKADIFSLGVTIYELMTRESIPSNGEEWHRIRRLELSKLEKLRNYSDTLKKLIFSMLNPNPDDRPSAEQLLVSDFLRSEIELELQWERTQNRLYQEKIQEYEKILKIKRKNSF